MTTTYENQDGVGIITMNDGKANVFNPESVAAMHAALDQAEQDAACSAIVITGMAGRFSGGFDLAYFQANPIETVMALVESGGHLAYRVFNFPKPVIGAISGHAVAMGCFLALACDRRIGIDGDFKMGANETAINMVVPRYAMDLLRYRLSPNAHDESAIFGTLYNPKRAQEVGLLDSVVASEKLMDVAISTAKYVGGLPNQAYVGNKRLVRESVLKTMAEGLGIKSDAE